ncbi:MAG TPA: choice-of-anchor P family protein [Verrucomicrobiae bacterium]|jgi:hypothetical protein|nr:choice-of-anchor P family protein [Verrucomicrobiae bacterium]
MPKPSPRYQSQYMYQACAYGFAAEIERPVRQSVPSQASSVLPTSGGRGSGRVDKFSLAPFISVAAAYTEVGGSFDPDHNKHTTYASSTVEGLNIADVVTADKVVSHMVIYSSEVGKDDEPSFSITGSHFDNLRVAGHEINIKLATLKLHQCDTYSKFESAIHAKGGASLLPWGDQDNTQLNELEKLEDQYHALSGIGQRAKQWKKKPGAKGGAYWCSPAGHLDLKDHVKETELENFGAIIVVPKFGVVRLAELLVTPHSRRLTMFRVQMCSGSTGSSDGGGTTGSGGMPPPG